MEIRTSILFYLLSKRYNLAYDKHHIIDIPVTIANPYKKEMMAGKLYVMSGDRAPADLQMYPASAFLLLGQPPGGLVSAPNAAYCLPPVDLEEAYDGVAQVINEFQSWHSRIKDTLLEPCSLNDVFEISREVLDLSFALIDRNLSNVAHCPDYLEKFRYYTAESTRVTDMAAMELMLDREFHENFTKKDVYIFPTEPCDDKFLCQNFFVDGQNVARFHAILDDPDLSIGEIRVFEQIADYVRRVFTHYTDDIITRHQKDKLHILMRSLIFIHEPVGAKEIAETLELYNWRGGHGYVALVFRFFDDLDLNIRAQHLCQTLEKLLPNSCALAHERDVVCIVNFGKHASAVHAETMTSSMAPTMRDFACRAGISDVFADPTEVGVYCRQAGAALRIGQQKNPHSWYFLFDDYILDYMVAEACRDCSREQLMHKGVLQLMEYDKTHGTDYVHSLQLYLGCRFNAAEAAEKAFVHRSTFIMRLSRIEEISDIHLDRAKDITHIFLSFYLLADGQGVRI